MIESPICSETLSIKQYKEIMNEISRNHRFGSLSKSVRDTNRCIKYVRPSWDMRDGRCYYIQFDEVGFDFRGSERSMFERIMGWLQHGEEPECGGLYAKSL